MLKNLRLKNVGPASEMELELAPRLNIITGDNGLGKSFLLDVAWWALTETWARGMVLPHYATDETSQIAYCFREDISPLTYASEFERRSEDWSPSLIAHPLPGLILYAQVDGGFSVRDSERNHARKELPSIFSFRPEEVWEGNAFCEGLIRNWVSWQSDNGDAFRLLEDVLQVLSPSPDEPLRSGRRRRISVDDPKDYPTIKMPYNQEVAVIHASAGLRRIIALAYLLVWTWQEHLLACELRRTAPAKDIVFLFDEVEAHLHPQWQRRILPALFAVMAKLTGEHAVNVQMIAATHSPLALASLETFFDSEQDAWFDIDLVRDKRKVVIERRGFIRKGTAGRWLTSEAFDLLSEGRSLEGEQAIAKAEALLDRRNNGATLTKEEIEGVDAGLRQTLPDIDRFWVRWRSFVDEGGWLQ